MGGLLGQGPMNIFCKKHWSNVGILARRSLNERRACVCAARVWTEWTEEALACSPGSGFRPLLQGLCLPEAQRGPAH